MADLQEQLGRLAVDRQPATRADVQALQREVAALREAIIPSPSPIVHGAEALRAFLVLQARGSG
eukprot:gene12228-14952_t